MFKPTRFAALLVFLSAIILVTNSVYSDNSNGRDQQLNKLCAGAIALLTDSNHDRLLVQEEKWVSVYRLSDLKFVDYLPLEGHPKKIVIDSKRSKIFVALSDEPSVAVFNLDTLEVVKWYYLGNVQAKVDSASFKVDKRGRLEFLNLEDGSYFSEEELAARTPKMSAPAAMPPGVTPSSNFGVNTTDAGPQTHPRVSFDGTGNFAFVWTDQNGNDGSGDGAYFREFLINLTAPTANFKANKTTAGNQSNSHIAVQANGDFIITWRDDAGADGDSFGVFHRAFTKGGTPKSPADQLSTQATGGRQMEPAITTSAAGTYTIAYSSPDADGRGMVVRRFNSSGTPLNNESFASSTTQGITWGTDISGNAIGQSVVVWRDDSADRIRGRAYHADGTPVSGTQFTAGPFLGSSKNFEPTVAVAGDGSFVVAWREIAAGGIIAQRFDSNQVAVSAPFKVSSSPDGGQYGASAAATQDGHFVICWRDTGFSTDDVVCRYFDSSGTPIGSDFKADENPSSDEFEDNVAMDPFGNFVVVWKDHGATPSLQARYFAVVPPPPPITIASVLAASGDRGTTPTVTITGSGFTNDATVSFNDPNITTATTFVDAQTLTVDLNIGATAFLGFHDITVSQSNGNKTENDLFEVKQAGVYPAPTVISILPGSGSQNSTVPVTITGTNFANHPGLAVDFGANITVNNIVFVNDTTITAKLAISNLATIGLRGFTVANPGSSAASCACQFDVLFDPTLFKDDFSDGNANDWIPTNGSWTVVGQQLQVTASGKATNVSPFLGCSICSFELDMKAGTGTNSYVSMLGWYVDKQNYVELKMDKANDRWQFKQKVNGIKVAKSKFSQVLGPNVTFHVKVTYDGVNFIVAVDSVPIMTVPAGAVPNGTIALRTSGTTGTFDNIVVLP